METTKVNQTYTNPAGTLSSGVDNSTLLNVASIPKVGDTSISSPATFSASEAESRAILHDQNVNTMNQKAEMEKANALALASETASKKPVNPSYNPDISIIDYLSSKGQPSTFNARAQLAKNAGITNYTGTAQQNQQLLGILQNAPAKKEPTAAEAAMGAISGATTTATPSTTTTTPGSTPTTPNEVDKYKVEAKTIADDIETAHNDFIKKMNDATAGKLTADEQSQVDLINKQFETLKQQQLVANQNYEAGTTQLGIVSGRQRYAPEVQLGIINSAISAGISKVTEITNKQQQAVIAYKQAVQDKNYKLAETLWKEANEYNSAKQKTLTDIYDKTTAFEKDIRDNKQKMAQENLQNIMEMDKFTYQQKKDAIDQALSQQQIDETKRKNLIAEANNAQVTNLINKMKVTPVPTSVNGVVDKTQRDAWISQNVPDQYQGTIKGLLDYTGSLSNLSLRKMPNGQSERQFVINMARQIDPSFDEGTYNVRQKYLNLWTSGAEHKANVAANTAVQHIGTLKTASDELENDFMNASEGGLFTAKLNTVGEFLLKNKNDPRVVKFESAAEKVANELAAAYKGGNASTSEKEQEREGILLSIKNSPLSKNAILETSINLLGDKINVLRESYTATMGNPPPRDQVITPATRAALKKMQEGGLNIDMNIIDPDPLAATSDNDLISGLLGNSDSSSVSNTDYFTSLLNNLNQNTTQ